MNMEPVEGETLAETAHRRWRKFRWFSFFSASEMAKFSSEEKIIIKKEEYLRSKELLLLGEYWKLRDKRFFILFERAWERLMKRLHW